MLVFILSEQDEEESSLGNREREAIENAKKNSVPKMSSISSVYAHPFALKQLRRKRIKPREKYAYFGSHNLIYLFRGICGRWSFELCFRRAQSRHAGAPEDWS